MARTQLTLTESSVEARHIISVNLLNMYWPLAVHHTLFYRSEKELNAPAEFNMGVMVGKTDNKVNKIYNMSDNNRH